MSPSSFNTLSTTLDYATQLCSCNISFKQINIYYIRSLLSHRAHLSPELLNTFHCRPHFLLEVYTGSCHVNLIKIYITPK
jgi:hypothetical protein